MDDDDNSDDDIGKPINRPGGLDYDSDEKDDEMGTAPTIGQGELIELGDSS